MSGTLPLGAVAFASFVNHGINWPLATSRRSDRCRLGLGNGFIVARLGINPLITTLGTLSIAAGLAYTFTNGETVPFNDPAAGVWGNTAFGDIQWGVIAFAVLALAGTLCCVTPSTGDPSTRSAATARRVAWPAFGSAR